MSEQVTLDAEHLEAVLTTHRIAAFAQGLRHAGYCEQSVLLAIEKNREWIQSCDWTEEDK